MSSFRILNKEGVAIDINDLDIEAAAFWGKEVEDKEYANPSKIEDFESEMKYHFNKLGNWFDIIGFKIAHLDELEGYPNYKSGWSAVISGIMGELSHRVMNDNLELLPYSVEEDNISLGDKMTINILGILEYSKPYIALIKHWSDKGYKPQQVK